MYDHAKHQLSQPPPCHRLRPQHRTFGERCVKNVPKRRCELMVRGGGNSKLSWLRRWWETVDAELQEILLLAVAVIVVYLRIRDSTIIILSCFMRVIQGVGEK